MMCVIIMILLACSFELWISSDVRHGSINHERLTVKLLRSDLFLTLTLEPGEVSGSNSDGTRHL